MGQGMIHTDIRYAGLEDRGMQYEIQHKNPRSAW